MVDSRRAPEIENARKYYVEGYIDETGNIKYPSLDEAAAKAGLSPCTVGRYSKKEHWQDLRMEFLTMQRNATMKLTAESRAEILVDREIPFHCRAAEIADVGMQLLAMEVKQIAEEAKRGGGVSVSRITNALKAIEIGQRVANEAFDRVAGRRVAVGGSMNDLQAQAQEWVHRLQGEVDKMIDATPEKEAEDE